MLSELCAIVDSSNKHPSLLSFLPQNVAKEGLQFGDEGEREKEWLDEMTEAYKPLTDWLKDEPLKDVIDKAVVSNRLTDSPCALVANQYGWWVEICILLCHNDVLPIASHFHFQSCRSGNMERIMRAQAYSQGRETE